MRLKKTLLACGTMLLVLPTIALAGGRPPEGVNYAETGATTLATTHTDKDRNKVAEKLI
ncbi:MAG: hypothetical protein IPK93_02230 [Solirubrobacterales bacterium]|nr:hypothetical protein [Solirubrobacterales bacterium]